eukprot:TRINITY_DN80040_c0_g1_i1.p1 TRINITY_DN80040_c0_g1~~TRINITY_DN80040_c0_g1_i1.p1  ORF type:complete len:716 (-),score=180.36 TRINITY_DN80040_c0_g1_i1:75-2222(-)
MASKAYGCPCCVERRTRRGGVRFLPRNAAPPATCEECLLPPPPLPGVPSGEVPPFQWPRTTEEINVLVDKICADAKAVFDTIAAVPDDQVSFDTVIEPIMSQPNYKTNPLVCQAKHLQHCSTDAAIREVAGEATTRLAACKKAMKERSDVYEKVKKFAESEAAKSLSSYDAYYVQAILSNFQRGGLSLDAANKEELRKLLDADAEVCKKYKTNLSEDKTRISFAPAELEGCEADFIKERTDSETGKVTLTLKYPDILPVLQNCDVASTRRQVALARDCAYGNNLDLVAEGVQLRKKTAALLGYASWAHFVTETRMSGSPEKVQTFLDGILSKAMDGGKKAKERLRQLKVTHLTERGELPEGGADAVTLDSWDTSFYNSLLLKREYGVDHEAIRKYFPLQAVVEGTLGIYQELLNLKFVEIHNFDTWHPEVRLFVVHDASSGDRMGHFYLDLHPRDGKYGHAAIFHLLKRTREGQTPVDCMLTNLPAESADGKPALLRHDDVVTFFHEFGHIMHGLCAEGHANQTSLAKCPRDFVEAPSQMLENWCYDREVLKRLSRHVDTGESLPEDQVKRLLEAKNVNEGFFLLRQIYLAKLDLAIHGEEPPVDAAGLQKLVDEIRPSISLVDNPPGCNMLRNFGHLMNQYSAAYYGYLWAEVISADMFATKFEADPFSKDSGVAYRKQVLAVGGVGKISEHLETFLGRAPVEDAFLKSRGILG